VGALLFRQQGFTATEIQGLLEEEESANHICDVLLMPPEHDDISDEDNNENDEIISKDANHLSKGILSQLSEPQVYDRENELPDLTVIE
jgi:hypothetical protein